MKVYNIDRFTTERDDCLMNNPIFALDIGTQSVAGVILKKSKDTYTILDYCIEQHNERAMLDGQIHDVIKVADIINRVKKNLEKKHGELTSVRVAAAGRSLKTILAEASMPLHRQPISEEESIRYLELTAVQNAQKDLMSKVKSKDSQEYYCVGYSVLHYKLDHDLIGSLIDQTGDQASVEVIATFLPQVVVESLLASLQRAKLTMEGLTLEPIAAINVLIPESMRRLNVALVDIGAGTSDIAITRDGTVTAYGMVDQAGDEITEAISDYFLLDFDTAERAKKQLVNEGHATVNDILDFPKDIRLSDLLQAIDGPIDQLAQALSDEILTLNKKAPQAIMLIGGGSLTPNIGKYVAEKLQLPENRVAVRTVDAIQGIENLSFLPQGPDFITPLGIAITSLSSPIKYTSVIINNETYRLFDMKKLTIGDCLIHSGKSLKNMYGKPGLAYMVKFNGKNITIPGELGSPPILTNNGKPAAITDFIVDGDEIYFEKGTSGDEPYISIKQLVDEIESLTVSINQKLHTFHPKYIVNGLERDENYIIQDKDEILVKFPETVKDVLQLIDENTSSTVFPVYVDNKLIHLKKGETSYKLNGELVNPLSKIKQNDHLIVTKAEQPTVKDVFDQLGENLTKKIEIFFNGQGVTIKKDIVTVFRNESVISDSTVILPNDRLNVKRKDTPFIFQDVFRFVDFDSSRITGHYKVYINDEEATFFDEINDGDHLEIK